MAERHISYFRFLITYKIFYVSPEIRFSSVEVGISGWPVLSSATTGYSMENQMSKIFTDVLGYVLMGVIWKVVL